jgi:hypothetical protein
MDYSEQIITYKLVSNFQCVWRYSCLNVTHKKPYKCYEERTNDLLIAFIDYVNDLSKFQRFTVKCSKNPTIDFNALFHSLGNSMCSSPEFILAFLRYEAALFLMQATNSFLVFTFSL